jgi:hypothetical protein
MMSSEVGSILGRGLEDGSSARTRTVTPRHSARFDPACKPRRDKSTELVVCRNPAPRLVGRQGFSSSAAVVDSIVLVTHRAATEGRALAQRRTLATEGVSRTDQE